ncbi:MAG: hypothetical protein V2B19_22885 [Pseudomonadota bacterium]
MSVKNQTIHLPPFFPVSIRQAQSELFFRAHLIKEFPGLKENHPDHVKKLSHQAKALIKHLAQISLEIAQLVVTQDEGEEGLPDGSWWKSPRICPAVRRGGSA